MNTNFKVQKSISSGNKLSGYMDLVVGSRSYIYFIKYEFIILFSSWVPGILGLALRSILYPLLLGRVGKGVIFGRNITLRHPGKIFIGDGTVVDDGCMLDAKGEGNKGIDIGNGVYIGRNTIIYCKNGDIILQEKVNIGHNSIVFSSNKVEIGREVLIAAYTYIMSGGSYDYKSSEKIIDQSGYSKGPTVVGPNCWIGAKAIVGDGVSIGRGCVIGAGAVVLSDVPEDSIAVGVPGRVIKKIR